MDAMATNPSDLTSKLRRLCDEHGLSQSQFADAVGVSRASASDYMSGAIPGPAVLLAIAKRFGVTIDWLCDDTQRVDDPPTVQKVAASLPDDVLISEAARRLSDTVKALDGLLTKASEMPWDQIAAELDALVTDTTLPDDLETELPAHLRAALQVAAAVNVLPIQTLRAFKALDSATRAADQARQRCNEVLKEMVARPGSNQAVMMTMREYVFSMDREDGLAAFTEALNKYRSAAKKK